MVLDELRDSSLRRHNGDLLDPSLPPVKVRHGAPDVEEGTMLARFLQSEREVARFRGGQPVVVDGHTLTTAGVVAASRYHSRIELDDCHRVKDGVAKSRKVITDKVESGTSVYGLSTGFGGSADTRTDKPLLLGHALLQHQHAGVLPTSDKQPEVLPILDPLASTAMPEAWVRGAMLIRMNSLVRGHSGVRWELLEKMKEVFMANITPVVPVRSSISASGDLSSLSYIAGTLVGNPSIKVFHTAPSCEGRQIASSADALSLHGIEPISLASKEHLGILNGTAFSASVAALAAHDSVHLALLSQVCTAMGTEALRGNRGSYDSFIHRTARPHPGQVETAKNIWDLLQGSSLAHMDEEEVSLAEDKYSLRQDRYPLRTSPQFLGPQVEDILSALNSVTLECNSTTDNPLVDGETGHIHHGGNFQAMAVTNAMEKTRLSLAHIGKLMFAQCTELLNPSMNNGLPPSLAATDPSLNYHGKGIDIATAAYCAELGHLAAPVSTHIQSAEMHNQAVNSLALISARSTINSIQVLSILMASYIYLLCQAMDLRALEREFNAGLRDIVHEECVSAFASFAADGTLESQVLDTLYLALSKNTTMDNVDRMKDAASATSTVLLTFFTTSTCSTGLSQGLAKVAAFASIPDFHSRLATRAAELQEKLRAEFLTGARGPAPAASLLGKTQAVYTFVRTTLGVRMHGVENFSKFANGLGRDDTTIGGNISIIYEAIRDGKMSPIVSALFSH